ncbi:MAG: hypothetical protein QOI31_110 [Solirubrobacterales bacterium]|jgi:hypothetical protein|nr:hypothetical protein [Solirubrobacterales bacterium]
MLRAMADWRDEKLDEIRSLVKEAVPEIVEEMKWKTKSNPDGVHTWYHEGLIGHGQTFKGKVKVTFAKGGALDDPKGVFDKVHGGKSRTIDLYEGDKLNKTAFKKLVRDAAKLNES